MKTYSRRAFLKFASMAAVALGGGGLAAVLPEKKANAHSSTADVMTAVKQEDINTVSAYIQKGEASPASLTDEDQSACKEAVKDLKSISEGLLTDGDVSTETKQSAFDDLLFLNRVGGEDVICSKDRELYHKRMKQVEALQNEEARMRKGPPSSPKRSRTRPRQATPASRP